MATNRFEDIILVYTFLNRLVKPFKETDAYKLGIIDERGKNLIKARNLKTTEQKNAYGMYDRMIFNLKKLIEKLPGGQSRLASYGAALFLVREGLDKRNLKFEDLNEELMKVILTEKVIQYEDVPTNATGASVAGTGDDPIHWKDGRKKETKAYLKKYLKSRMKREEKKKKEEILRRTTG